VWPKYVCTWSIRHRVGDGDFPLATGEVDRMPPREGQSLDDVIAALRDDAVVAANATAASTESASPPRSRSLLKRLFGS
jgi:hypothetical protein